MLLIPVFLINLDSAAHRLRDMQLQLDRMGIPFERIPAIVGKELSIQDIEKISPPGLWIGKRRPSPGELGCFLSHVRVLDKIIARNLSRACILEDDIRLSNEFVDFLSPELTVPPDIDILKFEIAGPTPRLRSISIGSIRNRELAFLAEGGWPGSAAYIVTQRGARNLRADLNVMLNMYDSHAFDYSRNNLVIYHVLPLLATQVAESEMGRPMKAPRVKLKTSRWLVSKVQSKQRKIRRRIAKVRFQFEKFGVRATLFGKKTWLREDFLNLDGTERRHLSLKQPAS